MVWVPAWLLPLRRQAGPACGGLRPLSVCSLGVAGRALGAGDERGQGEVGLPLSLAEQYAPEILLVMLR